MKSVIDISDNGFTVETYTDVKPLPGRPIMHGVMSHEVIAEGRSGSDLIAVFNQIIAATGSKAVVKLVE